MVTTSSKAQHIKPDLEKSVEIGKMLEKVDKKLIDLIKIAHKDGTYDSDLLFETRKDVNNALQRIRHANQQAFAKYLWK